MKVCNLVDIDKNTLNPIIYWVKYFFGSYKITKFHYFVLIKKLYFFVHTMLSCKHLSNIMRNEEC